jgi:hypothetical protein
LIGEHGPCPSDMWDVGGTRLSEGAYRSECSESQCGQYRKVFISHTSLPRLEQREGVDYARTYWLRDESGIAIPTGASVENLKILSEGVGFHRIVAVQAFVETRTPRSRPGRASRAGSELEEQRASPSITNLSNFHRILSFNGLSGRAVVNSERFASSKTV